MSLLVLLLLGDALRCYSVVVGRWTQVIPKVERRCGGLSSLCRLKAGRMVLVR